MKSKRLALQKQIARIKEELRTIGDIRPGSLSEQYNVCGNANCRCKDDPPQKHGPYFQLSFVRNRKSTTRFIRPPSVQAVRQQISNYKKLRGLIDQWIDSSMELCDLQLEEDRATKSTPSKTKKRGAK